MWLDIINLHKNKKQKNLSYKPHRSTDIGTKTKKGPSRGKIPRHVSTRRTRTPHYSAREDAFAHTRALFPSLSAPQKKKKKNMNLLRKAYLLYSLSIYIGPSLSFLILDFKKRNSNKGITWLLFSCCRRKKKNFLIEKKIKPPSDAATWFLASDKQAQMHHVQQYIVIVFLY